MDNFFLFANADSDLFGGWVGLKVAISKKAPLDPRSNSGSGDLRGFRSLAEGDKR